MVEKVDLIRGNQDFKKSKNRVFKKSIQKGVFARDLNDSLAQDSIKVSRFKNQNEALKAPDLISYSPASNKYITSNYINLLNFLSSCFSKFLFQGGHILFNRITHSTHILVAFLLIIHILNIPKARSICLNSSS